VAITQVEGRSHCRPSCACVLGVLDFDSRVHTVYDMHTQFRMAQNSTSTEPTGMLTSACVEECLHSARTHSINSKVFGKSSKFDWDTGYSELFFLVTFLNSSAYNAGQYLD
jgi:hypothetical protein